MVDLLLAGWGDDGSKQSAAQRPPDGRRREALEAVRGVGMGGGRPLPQGGFGGVTPEKIFKLYVTNGEFSCI